ncbi:MAG: 6-bladed beta-propeller [Candidatus Aminicenantales bacterium]
MEEELSIGKANRQEEFMFSMIISIAVDEEERVYVLDIKERDVKVYDRNGNFIRTIGRRGQGPGELENPYTVQITSQNEVVVYDPMRRHLVFFSFEGNFMKNLSIDNLFNPPYIDSKGNIIGIIIIKEKNNPRYELQKFDSQLNYLHSLDSSPYPNTSQSG